MEKRLPGLIINSYGLANFSLSLMMSLGMMYYAMFLTDVAMISAIHMGLIMAVGGAIDAISIPISGSIIQKTQMRWGQFRSWFLFIPVITCIFFTLSFTNLPLSYGLKIVFLTLTFIIGHISLNFAFNAHLGFISVLSSNLRDRLRVSTRNIQFGMASQIVFSVVVIKVLNYLNIVQNPTLGYFYTVGALAVFQMFGYWNLFHQTREFEKYDPAKNLNPSSKITIWEIVTQLFGNRQLLLLMSADVMSQMVLFSVLNLAIYYLKYIAVNEGWMTYHTLSTSITSFVVSLYAPFVINFLGKKKTYLVALTWAVIGYLFLRAFGAISEYHFTFIICSVSLLLGTSGPMRQAMYMDAAEYGYYKTGKDASAFIMSMFTIPIKIAAALAGTVAGFGLSFIGYVAEMEMTEQVANGLMDIICYIPAGCGIIAVFLMSFYSLTDANMEKIMESNKLKRAEATA